MIGHERLARYCIHRFNTLYKPPHIPFINNFREHVLQSALMPPAFIEQIRKTCYGNREIITSSDPGAGPRYKGKKRSIGRMSKIASVSRHYGALLYRLAAWYKPVKIIELGTGIGMSALYLTSGNPEASLITIEGNAQLAKVASENFQSLGLSGITLINKPFDEVIDRLAAEIADKSIVYVDGNHTLEATLRYFDTFGKIPGPAVILVFDDINWSDGMIQAWKAIANSPHTGLAIDLFNMGIVFQGYGFNNQKIRLWY